MQRYNIPTRGIEVVIDAGQSAKQQFSYRDDWKGVEVAINERKRDHATMPVKPSIEQLLDYNEAKDFQNNTHADNRLDAQPFLTDHKAPIAPDDAPRRAPIELVTTKKRRPVRYFVTRSVALAATLAAVGNIPVHSKVSSPADYPLLSDQHLSNQLLIPAMPQETFVGFASEIMPLATEGKWKLRQAKQGDTLDSILKDLKLTITKEDLFAADPAIAKQLNKLEKGARLLVQTNENTLTQLLYITRKKEVFIVAKSETSDSYVGKWDNNALESDTRYESFTLKNPLHYEVSKKGLPMSIARQITKIFAKDVNFRRLSPSDTVTVIFDEFRLHNDIIYTGYIKAAKFEHHNKSIKRVRFVRNSGKVGYLRPDSDLELKKIAFDRRPVKRGRLSSHYGFRRHPVFGSRRLHAGTDFAAPRGTPIYATGDGRVKFVGRKGGYGKTVMLKHAGGITTLFGHMSRYKKGLRNGQRVSRGEVIGYVGSTGTSTGNHVHYEYSVNGRKKNPMRVALPSTGILTKTEMKNFKKIAKSMTSELQKASETAKVDRNLRTEFGG